MRFVLMLFTSLFSIPLLASPGMTPWQWKKSNCQTCGIYFQTAKNVQFDDQVIQFKKALEDEKSQIMEIYNISGQEYNLLAWMALGILGNESSFFMSSKYKTKENFQWVVYAGKYIRSQVRGTPINDNSRGPTQIKNVPDPIEYHYNITTNNLRNPKNAAVATVGFLIEALDELKNRASRSHQHQINSDTYVDYLPYIYTGRAKMISNGTATPEKNKYVQNMKKNMGYFRVFEVRD